MADTTASGAEFLDFALYRYEVSLPAAIAAAAVFLVLTLLHVWLIYRHRSFYFTAFTIGGCCTYTSHPVSVVALFKCQRPRPFRGRDLGSR
jgi:hypothetical protein